MSNAIIQGASRAAPILLRSASRIALAFANQAISRLFDNRVFEGPRLESFHVLTSRDGAPMARVFGRIRLAGQVIWATHIKESVTEENVGGKGGGPRQRNYTYTISFAVGLCEGPITGIGRIWANGGVLQSADINYRVHHGGETQEPDPLIAEIEDGDVPAFRGTAYVVFEDFPLDDFGARLPQLNIEVFRQPAQAENEPPRMEELIRGVNLIPGSGEAAYAVSLREERLGVGVTRALNRNNMTGSTDVVTALDQLETHLPNCKSVNIVVSWFGGDLRCGHCQIRPGVESADREMEPITWRVCGQDRSEALLIRQVDGHSVYGGTPSDDSVIELITELKARGFKVGLYPFILMDVFGKSGQGEFPWRGRISVDSNTPGDSAQAEAEVASFFGNCQPSDFGFDGQHVTYSGPNEHSFRRHILHYAKLCEAAGGVDHFLIGTEMRGLTTVRGSGLSYPAVSQFQTLAADVRALVGSNTKLSYAADWSEYFGHHFGDNVIFHLDPLWADPNIDGVAIDAYFPLSDWRENSGHLDEAIAQNIYDPVYLSANVEGGEGYEWYYASAADRDAQIRTPITDGVYNKPWIYRYKDLRNWWAQPHFNRINGIEKASPTAWTPQSKPFWLTEFGCPAIDKGANQPNVFYDPKSSESAAPYFSTAERDDLIQRRYIEAFLSYYDAAGSNNPVSSVYAEPMIDTDKSHIWCWDARPYPDFPARTNVWADGPNWQLGHWLSGRVGAALLPDILTEIVLSAGLPAPGVSGLSGVVEGYVLDRPMSARAALEPLAAAYDFTVIEGPEGLRFAHNGEASATALGFDDIVEAELSPISSSQESDTARLRDVRVHFIDAGRDFALGMARAGTDVAEVENIADIDLPLVLDASRGRVIAEHMLTSALAAQSSVNFTLMPSQFALEVGDVVSLPDIVGEWQIVSLQGQSARRANAVRMAGKASPIVGGSLPDVPPSLPEYSAPVIQVLDIPTLGDEERSGPLVGAYAAPFSPVTVSHGGQSVTLDRAMHFGVLKTPLARGPVGVIDQVNICVVEMVHGTLSSVTDEALFSGANAAAIRGPQGWEIIQFGSAELIGDRTYRLLYFIRGQLGSDAITVDELNASSDFIILNNALKPLNVNIENIGESLNFQINVFGREQVSESFGPYEAVHLKPLSPVHVKAELTDTELHLTWIRRTRNGGDSWAGTDVPLGEEVEQYLVEILDGDQVVFSQVTTTPEVTILLSDLPPSTSLNARVAQLSQKVGVGYSAEIELPNFSN